MPYKIKFDNIQNLESKRTRGTLKIEETFDKNALRGSIGDPYDTFCIQDNRRGLKSSEGSLRATLKDPVENVLTTGLLLMHL